MFNINDLNDLPQGVMELIDFDKGDYMPNKSRDFIYKGIWFHTSVSNGGWYCILMEIPVEIFDTLFYDNENNTANKEFRQLVDWRYACVFGCEVVVDISIDNPIPVVRRVWLEFNGLDDKPMTWNEYETIYNTSTEDPGLSEYYSNIRKMFELRSQRFEEYVSTFPPGREPRVNVWDMKSIINEGVRLIDKIIAYAICHGIDCDPDSGVKTPEITSFSGKYQFLSNFYPCTIQMNILGETFVFMNAEAAFQAHKCVNPDEIKQFTEMTGKQAKRAGRKVKLRSDWENVKDKIMEDVVNAKFDQNSDLREKLVATNNRPLIEGNTWNDRYWGVCKGRGQNKLGDILMKCRSNYKHFTN